MDSRQVVFLEFFCSVLGVELAHDTPVCVVSRRSQREATERGLKTRGNPQIPHDVRMSFNVYSVQLVIITVVL